MVLALDGRINSHNHSALIASNLLDFVYFNSGMCQGPRDDPQQAAFGLIGWGDIAPAWLVANYGDDNARAMLATAVAAAALKSTRGTSASCARCSPTSAPPASSVSAVTALTFPPSRRTAGNTITRASRSTTSPHFESYLWACYLWAYHHTGFRPFLDRTQDGHRA